MKKWLLSISSADDAPSTAPILLKGDILSNIRKASELGYDAIEVHLREDEDLDIDRIKNECERNNVKISSLVTGRLNTEGKCNLMDDIPYITAAAIAGMKEYIRKASLLGTDIILGWVKGNIAAGGRREKYMTRLARNLTLLDGYADEHNVRIFIEVINRYEVNVFNTTRELVDFITEHKLKNCAVHLDTFHMNIDESDPIEAIKMCEGRLGYFHLADNQRQTPGTGQIDFKKIFKTLDEVNYSGYLSVECLPLPDAESAAAASIKYIRECIEV